MTFMPTVENIVESSGEYLNSSEWGDISDYLKFRIRLCNKDGSPLDDSGQIICIAVDGSLNLDNQYATPFENSNPEHRLPTLMGMLQSGDWVNTLDIGLSNIFGVELSEDKKESLNVLEGRTNLTKVNSTQIFVSSAPVQFQATLYFSAWFDAKVEVEDQLKLLKEWSLPQELNDGSILASALEEKSLTSLFPSIVPPYVAVYYGGKCYLPLLIQSVGEPLVVPIDSDGNRLALQVTVNFVSRTAWDKSNISGIY